jgi:4-aminobutyrate aminotransferase-like enzyme
MNPIDLLKELRAQPGEVRTRGLDDAALQRFASDEALAAAIADAHAQWQRLRESMPEFLELGEQAQIERAQSGFINFYAEDAVCPFVALASRGPWIVTTKGAVLYDCGGYGMLGFGHNPEQVLEAMSRPQVMANVMTANVSQLRLSEALRKELGRNRGGSPYSHFLCLNSGSESVTLAGRIADVNARLMTAAPSAPPSTRIRRVAITSNTSPASATRTA